MDFKLIKEEKLRSRTSVERLFSEGKSIMAFPLRAVYRLREPGEASAQFLITIPKKRIRKAVMRVTLRRRTREAYRLNRREHLLEPLAESGYGVDIAFIYLDSTPAPYRVISDKVIYLLNRIATAAVEQQVPTHE